MSDKNDLSKIAATAPEHIWLDLGEEAHLVDDRTTFKDLAGVTWNEDNATGQGIKYVRALAPHPHWPFPAVAATQPNAAPGDGQGALLNEIGDWLDELKQANFDGHVPQSVFAEASGFAERIEALAAPSTATAAREQEDAPLDVLLAKFHAAVWEAATNEAAPVDYDLAGVAECKAIKAHVHRLYVAAQAAYELLSTGTPVADKDYRVVTELAASLASPSSGGWMPTAENVNALPQPIRDYIHGLAANCDPSGMVRENALLRDTNAGLQKMYRAATDALTEVQGCFDMAESEGLSTALEETTDERLKDLVERRLMYAMLAAAPKSGDKSHE